MIKAMLVDDEALSIKMLENVINWGQYGIEIVDTASDGLQAIEKYKEYQPDIVITDIKMPNLDGIEFIKKVREINSEIEFILISAYAEFSFVKKAIKFGCSNYLLKPIDELELEKTLQSVVAKISDKIITKKYMAKSELQKKKQLLHDFMKTGQRAVTACEILSEFNANSAPFTLLNVSLNSETINEYVGLSDLAGEQMNYILDRIESIIRHHCDYVIFDYQEYSWVVILFCGDIPKIVAIAQEIEGFLLRESKLSAKICFSRTSALGKELPQLYDQVMQFMKYSLFINNVSIFGHGYNCGEEAFNKLKIATLTRDMAESLKQHNTVEAVRIMEEVFHISENISPRYLGNIYTFCFETLLNVKAILTADDSHAVENIEILSTTYPQISSISSMDKLRRFMIDVIRTVSNIGRVGDTDYSALVESGIEYLRSNYNCNLSLDSVCEYLAVSKSYFCYLFKRDTGTSIWGYLTDIRMAKAKEYLENTDWKSYMIAYSVGYDNPSYFSRLFKKLYNMTPSEYREAYLGRKGKV